MRPRPPRGGEPARGSARLRVAEDVRMKLSQILQRELDDPRLDGVHLTRVEMTPDLATALVHWRGMPGTSDDRSAAALRSAGGFLRRCLGRTLRLRHVPELEFLHDDAESPVSRMDSLLSDLAAARAARPPSLGADDDE